MLNMEMNGVSQRIVSRGTIAHTVIPAPSSSFIPRSTSQRNVTICSRPGTAREDLSVLLPMLTVSGWFCFLVSEIFWHTPTSPVTASNWIRHDHFLEYLFRKIIFVFDGLSWQLMTCGFWIIIPRIFLKAWASICFTSDCFNCYHQIWTVFSLSGCLWLPDVKWICVHNSFVSIIIFKNVGINNVWYRTGTLWLDGSQIMDL